MDLILYRGNIVTMDRDLARAEALAIRGNKIEKLGSNEEVLALKTQDTQLIDLGGRLVLPGFIDTHMHLYSSSIKKMNLDLVGVESIEEIIERGRAYIEENKIPQGEWVVGEGWNQDYFTQGEKRFPTREDLDKISLDHPIYIDRTCYHVTVANSKALEIAGITEDTQKEGGELVLEDGRLNGVLLETAGSLVADAIRDDVDKAAFKETIKYISPYLHKEGLTSVHGDDISRFIDRFPMVVDSFQELIDEGELKFRVYEQSRFYNTRDLDNFLKAGYRSGVGNEYFKIGPLKLLGDGSLGARTAALSRPYSDDPSTRGIPVLNQEELDRMISLAHKNQMHTVTHAIGDQTATMVLNSIERALEEDPREDHRHGIVHCQITTEEIMDRYRELGVMAYIQPIFIEYDRNIVRDRVGDLADSSYDWQGYLDKGVRICFGSDSPVEPFSVIRGIYHAVTMKGLDGREPEDWALGKGVSVYDAVYAYTQGAAYASFEEDIKGSLTRGKLADIVVLSQDIFQIEADDIKDVEVDMTIFDGELVYKR